MSINFKCNNCTRFFVLKYPITDKNCKYCGAKIKNLSTDIIIAFPLELENIQNESNPKRYKFGTTLSDIIYGIGTHGFLRKTNREIIENLSIILSPGYYYFEPNNYGILSFLICRKITYTYPLFNIHLRVNKFDFMMKCKKCKSIIYRPPSEHNVFCMNCGNKIPSKKLICVLFPEPINLKVYRIGITLDDLCAEFKFPGYVVSLHNKSLFSDLTIGVYKFIPHDMTPECRSCCIDIFCTRGGYTDKYGNYISVETDECGESCLVHPIYQNYKFEPFLVEARN